MNKSMILGVLRHLLTTLGGAFVARGALDDGLLSEAVGALVALAGVAWSIWVKRKESDAAVQVAANLLVAGLLGLSTLGLMTGCSTVDKDGPYQGDSVLYNADKTILDSYDLLHSFVSWEYANRAALAKWPEIRAAADEVRRNAERWIGSAQVLREAYAADPSPANKDALRKSLAMLRAALSETTQYLNRTE